LLYWLDPSELSAQTVRLVGRPGPASGGRLATTQVQRGI